MWEAIKAFFKDSETIFWARLQTLLGIIGSVIDQLDVTLLSGVPSWFAWFLVANGVVTEILRRRRDEDMSDG